MYLAWNDGTLWQRDYRALRTGLQWLFWQVGGPGPIAGHAHHFRRYAREKINYAIDRYTKVCKRLYSVMERRLHGREFLADEYSIADIACLPWIYRHERQGQKLADFPCLHSWYRSLMSRPSVIYGLAVASGLRDDSAFPSDHGRAVFFGEHSDPGTREPPNR